MGPTAFHGILNLDLVFQLVLKYVSKIKAAKLFAHMLQTATDESVCSVYDSGYFTSVAIPTVISLLRYCFVIVYHSVFCVGSCVLVDRVTTSKLRPCLD